MKQFISEKLLGDGGAVRGTKSTKKWFVNNGYEKEYEEIIEKTLFLKNPTMIQRIYHIINDIDSEIKCPNCKTNSPAFITINKGYATYCSCKCQAEFTKEVRKNTIIEKYGSYPFLSDSALEKRKKTCLEKYGTEFPFQNKEIQDKQTQTMLDLYGVENPSQLQHIKDKKVETCLKNWGTENPNQCQQIQDKKKSTCLEKYGVEYFFQTDVFKESISDYNFPRHSVGENEIFEHLGNILDCEIIQGNRSVLNGKELDIYIPDKNLAIEYCGLYWHSNKFRNNSYHKEKFDLCKEHNIRLITIFEDEWLNNKELIKTKLSHILDSNNSKKVFARKCEIKKVSNKEKTKFYESHHIQGNGNSSIHIGLYYEQELVSCMSFKQRKQKIFELDRFATKYTIPGGFNKLLNHFKIHFDWLEIITFADLRWHIGDVYIKSGFKYDKLLNPDYYYIINNKRSHKFNFRKSSIKKKYSDLYNDALSESENMKNIGILKIYDCGKIRFKLINGI